MSLVQKFLDNFSIATEFIFYDIGFKTNLPKKNLFLWGVSVGGGRSPFSIIEI